MKNGWTAVLMGSVMLMSCNDSATVQVHINDSFEKKIDSGAKRILDSTREDLKKAGDQVEQKAKKLNEKFKEKLKEKKDSSRHD
jgi:hypothetical protein